MGMLLMTFTFAIERFITLAAASGKGSVDSLVRSVRIKLRANEIDGAIELCDTQKGSVANVLKATLGRYKQVLGDSALDKEQKLSAISKELEETTSLELPMLEKNLPILATLGSVATLVALLGTVLGMIKAFAGMAQAGAPDATALANGISEALVNTAIGIGTSAIAIIFYNYFTNKIDGMSYSIEEAGMSIAQTFSEKH
jgi:biopolymer transport protein ExbB